MLVEFILVSFASYIGWQLFRYFTFFPFNLRLAPVCSVLISYLFTMMSAPSWLIAFAATGGVAVLNRLTDATSPEPLQLPRLTMKHRRSRRGAEWNPVQSGPPATLRIPDI